MSSLRRIVLVLCFHILSVCASPTNSSYSTVLSPSAVLELRSGLHGRLKLEDGSAPLLYETAFSKNSALDPAQDTYQDTYKELADSQSVRRLGRWTGLSSNATFHLCSAFNFLLLVGLIYWNGYPRLRAALRERSNLIRQKIEEAQHLREEAQEQLAEIESRLARLDSEIASIRAVAEAAMKNEEPYWRAEAETAGGRILENAEREIEAAAQRAQQELRAFAAGLAVSIARQTIHVGERTDQYLIRALAKELENCDGIGKPVVAFKATRGVQGQRIEVKGRAKEAPAFSRDERGVRSA
jgi:F-type H+-transporting ATPase subunit b